MKLRTWLWICTALGLLAGAATFALTPSRYRALTTLEVKATRGAGTPDDLFPSRFRDQLDRTLRSAVSEENMVRLMRAHDLYRTERQSGQAWDALLRLRRSVHVVRKRESDTTERWTVAFEADDPAAAERGSFGLAELIKNEGDYTLEPRNRDFDVAIRPLLEDAKERLLASESKMKAWVRAHGGGPPAAMLKEYAALQGEYVTLLRRGEDERPPRPHHWQPPIETEFTIVRTPRVSDGRVAVPFLTFGAAGVGAGVLLGLATLTFFVWWREGKQAPDSTSGDTWSPASLIRVSVAWTLLGMLAGSAVYASAPRTFRSSVKFLVTTPAGSGVPTGGETDVERVQQAVQHVLAVDLLEAFVRELNLYDQDEHRMSIASIVDRLQSDIVVDIPPAGAGGLVDAFTLSFEHPDPDTAQRVTQLLSGHLVQPQFSMGAGLRMVADRFRIADGPLRPEEPVSPRWWRHLALGALAGLSAGLLLAFIEAFESPTSR